MAQLIRSSSNPILKKKVFFILGIYCLLLSCKKDTSEVFYDLSFEDDNYGFEATMIIDENNPEEAFLKSFEIRDAVISNLSWGEHQFSGEFNLDEDTFRIISEVHEDRIRGFVLLKNDTAFTLTGALQVDEFEKIDRSNIQYVLSENDLSDLESDVDHKGLLLEWNRQSYNRGKRIYNDNCINCHGTKEIEGSIPLSTKFWSQEIKSGSDPFSMYQTISRGYATMPPQLNLSPRQKYDVIAFIQNNFIEENPNTTYVKNSIGYRNSLPQGKSKGPESSPYHPWKDMDYGNFFINTYEIVDSETGPERFHSPGPVPYVDEDYRSNNFAYKGIALRLDKGRGGMSSGKAFVIFDHDLMRVAGLWTGEGFIDWNAILLNDRHETYPRTTGKLIFENPVQAGWANPLTGSFVDNRFEARDGRKFGPLPKKWANYKGLYYYEGKNILSYSVGNSAIMEKYDLVTKDGIHYLERTLNIKEPSNNLLLRVAPQRTKVELIGEGAELIQKDQFHFLKFLDKRESKIKLLIEIGESSQIGFGNEFQIEIEDLEKYTNGGKANFPQKLNTIIEKGENSGPFTKDILNIPFDNPWKSRMKLSGIDFSSDPNIAFVCTTDGDVWKIQGLLSENGILEWQRIAAGLFQPLGIKLINEEIFVTCRDQIVRLNDFNNDGETDFYESFNHDHQVTDHFHEFAMGLQADEEGNLYYAKSGRHARESLIPQHGTLLKVSPDGSKTEIIATGFRAANGVCINPDGSFIVTDQQGYWNPMNRINWIDVKGKSKFYGNMWGYNPPQDTSRSAMEEPMIWLDMEFDRSPSELLWVESEEWGPYNGSLLSFSYGYGKIQLVLHEEVRGQKQGGIIDIPGVRFFTGIMRGRFNPGDGQLYACGMSAWGTNQMMKGGGLYRIRYTGNASPIPVTMQTFSDGIIMTFAEDIDRSEISQTAKIEGESWNLKRSARYGSKRYNRKQKMVGNVELLRNNKSVKIEFKDFEPVDVFTLSYEIKSSNGDTLKGKLQSTIHNLK